MIRKNKNAFTLVELLAVIVILAIILVIAVPKIMNVIKDTTKASFESSAKMVVAQVENQYTVAQTLGKEFGDTGSCKEDWAGLNDVDYASCRYEITSDGNAKVTIKGSGKFKDLSVCNATRSSATAIEGICKIDTLLTHIQDLYANEESRISNGLIKDNTTDQNIRYVGQNVQNYVEFGNIGELWRIIGIFEVEKSSGGTEELVKIVRDESFKDSEGNVIAMSWDSSAETINGGSGINQWGPSGSYEGADLMRMLNGYFLGESTSCTYCNDSKQATCTNSCTNSITPISSNYRDMIENVVWNIGAIETTNGETLTPLKAYNAERIDEIGSNGEGTGKVCSATKNDGTENIECNDTVTRTIEWEGLVALPYLSEWGYASSESACSTNIESGNCSKNNWTDNGTWNWTISPYMHYSGNANLVWRIWLSSSGHAASDAVWEVYAGADYGYIRKFNGVRPTLYLKSNVQIEDGDGSSGNAYKLT